MGGQEVNVLLTEHTLFFLGNAHDFHTLWKFDSNEPACSIDGIKN